MEKTLTVLFARENFDKRVNVVNYTVIESRPGCSDRFEILGSDFFHIPIHKTHGECIQAILEHVRTNWNNCHQTITIHKA